MHNFFIGDCILMSYWDAQTGYRSLLIAAGVNSVTRTIQLLDRRRSGVVARHSTVNRPYRIPSLPPGVESLTDDVRFSRRISYR